MRVVDLTLQWIWSLAGVSAQRSGYDKGLFAWLRERMHKKARKEIRMCLLEIQPEGGKYGRFLTFWINEQSMQCSASLNQGIEEADIIWVYLQDPLSSDNRQTLKRMLEKARSGAPVMNHLLMRLHIWRKKYLYF